MNRLVFCLAAALAVAPQAGVVPFLAQTGIAHAAEGDPEAVIRSIYEAYGPDSWPQDPERKHFSPGLLKLWNEVQDGAGEDLEYAVDFDIFIDAQDVDTVTDMVTEWKEETPGQGTVNFSFTAFGEPHAMTFAMVKTPEGWKIDNLGWGTDRGDLRSLLNELKQGQATR